MNIPPQKKQLMKIILFFWGGIIANIKALFLFDIQWYGVSLGYQAKRLF